MSDPTRVLDAKPKLQFGELAIGTVALLMLWYFWFGVIIAAVGLIVTLVMIVRKGGAPFTGVAIVLSVQFIPVAIAGVSYFLAKKLSEGRRWSIFLSAALLFALGVLLVWGGARMGSYQHATMLTTAVLSIAGSVVLACLGLRPRREVPTREVDL